MEKEIVESLEIIKKLLILALAQSGASSEVIGEAIGVTGARVRQMVPMKASKKKIIK